MNSDFSLRNLIDSAQRYKIPIKFLQEVESGATLKRGPESKWHSGQLDLDPDAAGLAETGLMALSGPEPKIAQITEPIDSESKSLMTICHEATHGYLELKKKSDHAVKDFLSHEIEQYKNAKLEDGSTGNDPERIAHEAAALYVAFRIFTYWLAYKSIAIHAARWANDPNHTPTREKDYIEDMTRVATSYKDSMKLRIFGYQFVLNHGTYGKVKTTQPIDRRMKDFCDHKILEGRIGDQTANTPGLNSALENLPRSAAAIISNG